MKLLVGQQVSPYNWQSTVGATVTIPDPDGKTINLQFSRWAGCPICNMHLASFRRRAAELDGAGIKVVIVFHSPEVDVSDLRGDLPFALIADPDKKYYRAFGVKQSPFFLFNSKAFGSLRREAKEGRRAQRIHGGIFGLPADFVIDPNGKIIAAHYGRHADDNLSVDDVLKIAAVA